MLSPEEQEERDLWIASRRYVRGEISIDELEVIERGEAEKFQGAISVLARHILRQTRWNFFRTLIVRRWSRRSV